MSRSNTPLLRYDEHHGAKACVDYLSGTKLDDRIIRTEIDSGFVEGRQYGRGSSGGQVRDETRTDYDPGRGGYGTQMIGEEETETAFPSRHHRPEDGVGMDAGRNASCVFGAYP